MNIFVTSFNAMQCAADHCSIHRNKMIVEYAQLMSTAHSEQGTWHHSMYKPTHVNHPSAKWVRATKGNYAWLYDLWWCLLKDYKDVTGKEHKSARLMEVLRPKLIEPPCFTVDMMAMPDEYKTDDITISYRNYLRAKFNEWRSRDKPLKVEWIRQPSWA